MNEFTAAAIEIKFSNNDAAPGSFDGYASVFGNIDYYGDMILPGAFDASLTKRRAQNRPIPMYANHGWRLGSEPLPIGIWKNVEDDGKGLKVAGEIAAMDTDFGRRVYGLVKSGALGGISIGYKIAKNGVTYSSRPGEAKRTLKAIDLVEISLVDDPSDALAKVHSIKSIRDDMMEFAARLRDGDPPSIKEFEDILREAGIPKSMAVQIASVGYAKAIRSESGGDEANPAVSKALAELRKAVSGFTIPPL